MKILKLSFANLLIPLLLFCQEFPSGEDILSQVDENIRARNRVFTAKMIIEGRRGTRTVQSRSWVEGNLKSFTEYLSPAREKGTKMLKLEDQLWTYTPNTDRTIRISGHMLRQSVMGSDLSYEDLMEEDLLNNVYQSEVIGDTLVDDRSAWILQLIAREKTAAYAKRKITVDKERFIALKEERFATSGKLLKTTEVEEVQKVGERWVARKIRFKDTLKSGNGTVFILEEVVFDVDIPDARFSKGALKR